MTQPERGWERELTAQESRDLGLGGPYGVCAICRQPLTAERPTHAVEPNILTGEPGYFDCSNRKPVPLAEAAPEVK